jgi:hypothetical protein
MDEFEKEISETTENQRLEYRKMKKQRLRSARKDEALENQ